MSLSEAERDNLLRWDGSKRGFYEAYYLKWNDPEHQTAGWLRFGLDSPRNGNPQATLLGVYFDLKDPKKNLALTQTVPISETRLEHELFFLEIKSSVIFQTGTRGEIQTPRGKMTWDLSFHEPTTRLRHLPSLLYPLPWPETKINAPHLSCRLSGQFGLNDQSFSLQSLPAHQAHHWGTKLANSWVWGNCTDFQEDPTAVFEGLTAGIAIGQKPIRPLTFLFFVYRGKRYSFLSPLVWFQNRSRYETNRWHFEAMRGDIRFLGDLTAPREQRVRIPMNSPNGLSCHIHTTMVADLKINVFKKNKAGWQLLETLTANKTAAWEVAGPKPDPTIAWGL